MAKGMKYTGDGSFTVGVPARNLTQDEVFAYGHDWLIASGLYDDYIKKPKAIKPEDTIQEVEDARD